jgi:hypothetical protein
VVATVLTHANSRPSQPPLTIRSTNLLRPHPTSARSARTAAACASVYPRPVPARCRCPLVWTRRLWLLSRRLWTN